MKNSIENNKIFEKADNENKNKNAAKFPIVSIGASAGGINALKSFFANMPPKNGIAFIIIQHLDPEATNYLPGLIREYTEMSVLEVSAGLEIKPDIIYILPASKEIVLKNNQFKLFDLTGSLRLKMPVDFFLRSFVVERQDKSICILLSGTGTDGTLGIKEVKGAGGMVMVQDFDSAEFNNMPGSAINTGMVDYVLPPEKMPYQLISYIKNYYFADKEAFSLSNISHLDKIFIILFDKTGNDFSNYKKSTSLRRIKRRMTINNVESIENYISFLRQNLGETEKLFRELLIGVTSFFRDQEVFETIQEKVFPALINEKKIKSSIRIWVAGCSTGEEAYSLAIILKEYLYETKQSVKVQIFATDIDNNAVEFARMGIYPLTILGDVSQERLNRFFIKNENSYQLKKEIREMIIFAQQSLIKDPPFSKLDIISCRNLLIYFDVELQKKILPLFYYRLNEEGILILGTSESIGEFSDIFTTIDRKAKIFQRGSIIPYSKTAVNFSLSSMKLSKDKDNTINLVSNRNKFNVREFAENLLLENYLPCSILINQKTEILHFFGKTGKYLEAANGEANFNINTMIRSYIKKEVISAIREAISQKKVVKYRDLRVKSDTDNSFHFFNLVIRPLFEPESVQGLLLVIFDETEPLEINYSGKNYSSYAPGDLNGKISLLENELNTTREYLQTTVEELEATNEELKSTNEELQSSNEELQSTNEELETSKEELQAVNEELITVNYELHNKIDELSEANNNMHNLLSTTRIGTIFLDKKQRIKRFNPMVAKLFNLIPTDLSRPLSHISTNILFENLLGEVEKVLDTLIPKELEISARDGKFYSMRIIPYRTTENVIEGTVITFVEITRNKKIEDHLNKLIQVLEKSPSMIMLTDAEGNIEYVNSRFTGITGYQPEEIYGRNSSILKSGNTSSETFSELWKTLKSGKEWSGELCNRKKNGDLYSEKNTIYPIMNGENIITHFVAIKEDLSEQRKLENEIKEIQQDFFEP